MSQIDKSQHRQSKTLMETMQEIRQNIKNENIQKAILEQKLEEQYHSTKQFNQGLTTSMLNNSLRYNPDAWKHDLQPADLTAAGQLAKSQAQQQRNIEELEQSQAFTQNTLEALVNHINKHLQKLCDAVIILQRDVQQMKAHVYKQEREECCCCEGDEESEEEDEYEMLPSAAVGQRTRRYMNDNLYAENGEEEENEYECYCNNAM